MLWYTGGTKGSVMDTDLGGKMSKPPLPDSFTPKLKKGQLVEVTMGCTGTRPVTASELEQWREDRIKYNDWFDSAGETRLPPRYYSDDFSAGRKLTVLRAAASVKHVWYGRSTAKYALLLCTQTGHEYYVNKKYLRAV